MDKKKREQIILIIGVLVLAAMLPRLMFKKPQASGIITPLPDVFSQAGQPAAEPVVQKPLMQFEVLSSEITDPFDVPSALQEKLVLMDDRIGKPVVEEQEQQTRQMPKLDISGIIWGGDTPTAFINDRPYKIGDSVEDAKIVDIDKNGVHFVFDNRKEFIRHKKATEEIEKNNIKQ